MATTAQIIQADYTMDDDLTVRLFCVDDAGDPLVAVDDSFAPYFYVVPEADAVDAVADRLAQCTIDDSGDTVAVQAVERVDCTDGADTVTALKAVTRVPPDVPKLKDRVQEWDDVRDVREFDIPFYKRYIIDHQVAPATPVTLPGDRAARDGLDRLHLDAPPEPADADLPALSMLAFDLEVVDDEIIMCSLYGPDTETVLVTHDDGYDLDAATVVADEAALLDRFLAIVDDVDPDLLLGYNTDEFDFDVLRDRAEHHGIDLTLGRTDRRMTFQRRGRFAGATVEGRVHLDLYAFVANVVSIGLQLETLSLDNVAEALLGEGTDDVSWEELKAAWTDKEDLDRVARYALRDSELAFRLGQTLVPQIMSLSRLTGLPPFDTCRHAYGQHVENHLLMHAHDRGILAPNRPRDDERGRRYSQEAYTGGYVYEPEGGLHEDIALFDFRSLYPTIMVAHNISPDTYDLDDCDDPLDVAVPETDAVHTFCQDAPGFIPDLLEDLVRERYDLKAKLDDLDPDTQAYRDVDTRQNALKILSNAFYGYMGYAGARWYHRPAAEATTALGRRYIQETIETAEEMGFEIVYGDTDSVFIKGDDARERADAFQERVNAELPEFMELEFEGFYPRGLFTSTDAGEGAKKKYALRAADGTTKIVGFEQVRRDWSPVARKTQEQVIEQVLAGEVEAAVQTVHDTVDRLEAGEVPLEELQIYTTMNKKPENYAAKTPHSEAAKRAIARGADVSAGDTVAYVVTDGAGAISDRAELVQYADGYDATYYVENQVVPVALRVLKVFGYTEDQLLGKGKQTGLDRF